MSSRLISGGGLGLLAIIIYLVGEINFVSSAMSLEPESVVGRLISAGGTDQLSRDLSASCSGLYGPVCNGCNTLLTCVGETQPIAIQNCEKTYPGKPYCENNSCVSSVSAESECSPRRRCTAEGYFPHPTNCSQYYLCTKPNGISRVYECPTGYAYDAGEKRCTRTASYRPCSEIDCESNKNRYASYPAHNGYYAYCLYTLGVPQPIMFRCPDSYNFKFNDAEQRCEFKCYREGRFRDYRSCNNYFECFVGENNEYEYVEESCVEGYRYNMYTRQCEPGECGEGKVSTDLPYY